MAEHYKVVAIGGGPAGIATGVECLEFGLKPADVLILEKGASSVDAIRKFYPDKKMTLANYKGLPTVTLGHLSTFPDLTKAQTLDYFDDLIKKHGLQVRYQSEAFKVSSGGGGLKVHVGHEVIGAEVVTIGIGILGRPNKPAFKLPPSLKGHLLFDITSQKIEGQKVLVVGGGDTSSEYCQVLETEGNACTLICRGPDLSRMMETNARAAQKLSDAGKLRLILKMEVQEIRDSKGKPEVVFKDSDAFPPEVFDKVIFAIGGTTPLNFLRTAGIDCENDWPKLNEAGATNVPNLYLTGDLVAGKLGGSIITAYNSAFRSVSISTHDYVSSMISGYHQQVADHYEKFPYPDYPLYAYGSWGQLKSVDLRRWGIEGEIRNAWIVGCGTIAPLMFGRRNPQVAFYATDLSERTLSRLRSRLSLFGIRNVRTSLEDVLESAYTEAFDAIDCYGVLHHTVSPPKALEKIARALRTGGVLRLMLYSREARKPIEELRGEVVRAGLRDIQEIKKLLSQKHSHLNKEGDLKSLVGIADALLNPIVSTYDEDSLGQLVASQPRLQEISRSDSGNFVLHLKKK